jgi:hypothetical protein
MNPVISLPDDVTATAAALAERLGMPLGDLYAAALVAYCQKHDDGQRPIRGQSPPLDQLNQFYAQESSSLDPVIAQMQFASIPYEEW